jgi:hypothetical protein
MWPSTSPRWILHDHLWQPQTPHVFSMHDRPITMTTGTRRISPGLDRRRFVIVCVSTELHTSMKSKARLVHLHLAQTRTGASLTRTSHGPPSAPSLFTRRFLTTSASHGSAVRFYLDSDFVAALYCPLPSAGAGIFPPPCRLSLTVFFSTHWRHLRHFYLNLAVS